MIFVLGCISLGLGIYYYKLIQSKTKKFNELVKNYRARNSLMMAIYLSVCVNIKCMFLDIYHYMSSFSSKKYVFVKYVQGGNLSLAILPIQSGPRPDLEYAYIDNERSDDIVVALMGHRCDFSGRPDALLEFGNHIRFKFLDQEECILVSTGIESDEKNKKKQENILKLKKLMWISS